MKKTLEFSSSIESLFGPLDENLRLLERELHVRVTLAPSGIELEGPAGPLARVEEVFRDYQRLVREGVQFHNGDLHSLLQIIAGDEGATLAGLVQSGRQRSFGRKPVQPKTINQRRYLDAVERHDLVLGVGPAGTGKTYLAVAMAVAALLAKQASRIVLARPAVEAGERLGFLPGTVQEKVDPYLRPLYDALFDLLETERVERLLERNIIEIAPLAFMRGRTLNDAFIILDEAQNTTQEQMKMFLTRMGFHSKAVVTGDLTQIDLPNGRSSGLVEAVERLRTVEGIAVVHFDERDVVRHPLVQRIIRAYQEPAPPGVVQLPLLPPDEATTAVGAETRGRRTAFSLDQDERA